MTKSGNFSTKTSSIRSGSFSVKASSTSSLTLLTSARDLTLCLVGGVLDTTLSLIRYVRDFPLFALLAKSVTSRFARFAMIPNIVNHTHDLLLYLSSGLPG